MLGPVSNERPGGGQTCTNQLSLGVKRKAWRQNQKLQPHVFNLETPSSCLAMHFRSPFSVMTELVLYEPSLPAPLPARSDSFPWIGLGLLLMAAVGVVFSLSWVLSALLRPISFKRFFAVNNTPPSKTRAKDPPVHDEATHHPSPASYEGERPIPLSRFPKEPTNLATFVTRRSSTPNRPQRRVPPLMGLPPGR